ncbi:hypothetical protein NUSPORA_01614 [Nucleospora cyclopteri]
MSNFIFRRRITTGLLEILRILDFCVIADVSKFKTLTDMHCVAPISYKGSFYFVKKIDITNEFPESINSFSRTYTNSNILFSNTLFISTKYRHLDKNNTINDLIKNEDFLINFPLYQACTNNIFKYCSVLNRNILCVDKDNYLVALLNNSALSVLITKQPEEIPPYTLCDSFENHFNAHYVLATAQGTDLRKIPMRLLLNGNVQIYKTTNILDRNCRKTLKATDYIYFINEHMGKFEITKPTYRQFDFHCGDYLKAVLLKLPQLADLAIKYKITDYLYLEEIIEAPEPFPAAKKQKYVFTSYFINHDRKFIVDDDFTKNKLIEYYWELTKFVGFYQETLLTRYGEFLEAITMYEIKMLLTMTIIIKQISKLQNMYERVADQITALENLLNIEMETISDNMKKDINTRINTELKVKLPVLNDIIADQTYNSPLYMNLYISPDNEPIFLFIENILISSIFVLFIVTCYHFSLVEKLRKYLYKTTEKKKQHHLTFN